MTILNMKFYKGKNILRFWDIQERIVKLKFGVY